MTIFPTPAVLNHLRAISAIFQRSRRRCRGISCFDALCRATHGVLPFLPLSRPIHHTADRLCGIRKATTCPRTPVTVPLSSLSSGRREVGGEKKTSCLSPPFTAGLTSSFPPLLPQPRLLPLVAPRRRCLAGVGRPSIRRSVCTSPLPCLQFLLQKIPRPFRSLGLR